MRAGIPYLQKMLAYSHWAVDRLALEPRGDASTNFVKTSTATMSVVSPLLVGGVKRVTRSMAHV